MQADESSRRPARVVYVSYDGMNDPLGQSQVLPYLRGLVGYGHRYELLSFERPPHPQLRFRQPLEPGITWTSLPYHRHPKPYATLWDIASGSWMAGIQGLGAGVDLVHARSYISMAAAIPLARMLRVPLIFDTRGLWFHERVENGAYPENSTLIRWSPRIERFLLSQASAVTVLTHAMRDHLRRTYPTALSASIRVIPTCTDLDLFTPDGPFDPEVSVRAQGCRVLGYVGSLSGRYLAQEMGQFYLAWRKRVKSSRFLVVSKEEPTEIREVLSAAGCAEELIHRSAPRERMPEYIRCMDAGLFFYPPTVANCGVSPTKMGEMLACGVPVLGTHIGDAARMLERSGAGIVVKDLSPQGWERGAHDLIELLHCLDHSEKARNLAQRWYALEAGLDAYDHLYQDLLAKRLRTPDEMWPRTEGWLTPAMDASESTGRSTAPVFSREEGVC